MKSKKIRVLKNAIISLLLIFVSLFSSSCFYDPDEAVNIKDCIDIKYVVQADSTIFYFYYDSAEHPIEEYELIKVDLNYYADYKTSMRKKTFVLVVPDDIKQEDNKTYFTVKINDALGKESVIASVSVYANYKTEKKTSNSRWWKYCRSTRLIYKKSTKRIYLWRGQKDRPNDVLGGQNYRQYQKQKQGQDELKFLLYNYIYAEGTNCQDL